MTEPQPLPAAAEKPAKPSPGRPPKDMSQADQLAETMALIKSAGEGDFFLFCKHVLGFGDLEIVPHKALCDFISKPSSKPNKLILLPRGSFKTSIITIGWPIYLLAVKNPNLRILIDNERLDNAVVFLQGIKQIFESNRTFRSIYGNLVREEAWTKEEITIKGRNRLDIREPSVSTAGMGVVKVGMHTDLNILDDLHSEKNTTTAEQIEKVIDHYKLMSAVLEPTGQTIVVGCLVAGSRVTKEFGATEKIENMMPGDRVITHAGVQTVLAVIEQPESCVYKVKTGRKELEATANHPFMTRGGFKPLEEILPGDEVMVLRKYGGKSRILTKREAWLLGLMFGDGWITFHPNSKGSMRYVTCLAKSKYPRLNEKALSSFQSIFGTRPKETRFGYWRTEVADIGRWFLHKGLSGTAKTKRVPSFVFSMDETRRRSFLDGFVDADGYTYKSGRSQVEICNKDLLLDIKHLADGLGYNTTNIYSRTRTSQAPHSQRPIQAESHTVGLGLERDQNEFGWERIVSIEKMGVKKTWDLTVSGSESFVANGFVVHNTRWHYLDLYNHILENEKDQYDILIEQAIRDDGSLYFPKRLTRDYLDRQRSRLGPSIFAMQYQNQPINDDSARFKRSWLDKCFYRKEEMPKFQDRMLIIDPAVTTTERSDYSAFVQAQMDGKGDIWVLEAERHRFEPHQIIDHIIGLLIQTRISQIVVETNIFQKFLKFSLRQEMSRRRMFVPVREVKAKTTSSKDLRISALVPGFENGQIRVRRDMSDFIDEYLRYPKAPHDDILDALSYMTEVLRPQTEGGVPEKPIADFYGRNYEGY